MTAAGSGAAAGTEGSLGRWLWGAGSAGLTSGALMEGCAWGSSSSKCLE